jgi:hypothetical protein
VHRHHLSEISNVKVVLVFIGLRLLGMLFQRSLLWLFRLLFLNRFILLLLRNTLLTFFFILVSLWVHILVLWFFARFFRGTWGSEFRKAVVTVGLCRLGFYGLT